MGKRGIPPLPTQLKLVQGVRPSRVNRDEPMPADSPVEMPDWLSGPAQEVWERLAPDLIRQKVLTSWDVDAFADLCNVIVINREALMDIDRRGAVVEHELGVTTKNPSWQIARESSNLIVTLGGRFGLNPSDRSQLKMGAVEHGGSGAERLLG